MMRMYETQGGNDVRPPAASDTSGGMAGRGAGDGAGRGAGAATGAQAGEGRGAGRGAGGGVAAGAAETATVGAGQGDVGDAGGRGAGRGAGAGGVPTGRGGSQLREWYRGIPIPPGALANWSRRNNANYMQTGVLSGLQLTASFPNLIVENFYRKTQNSIDAGKSEAPYGYVIPVQRDMTRVAELVNLLRIQRVEIGQAKGEIKTSDGTFPGRFLRHQAGPAVRPSCQEPARAAGLPRSRTCARTTTAAGRWAWR